MFSALARGLRIFSEREKEPPSGDHQISEEDQKNRPQGDESHGDKGDEGGERQHFVRDRVQELAKTAGLAILPCDLAVPVIGKRGQNKSRERERFGQQALGKNKRDKNERQKNTVGRQTIGKVHLMALPIKS